MDENIANGGVRLRDVEAADLPTFFEQQQDAEATRMAAFPAREWDAFLAHWLRILADASLGKQTIVYKDAVAGNIGSFTVDGEREVGYWIGRAYWGNGIASQALSQYLQQEKVRPLYAHVAKHNIASRRVLEKCGFVLIGEDKDFADIDGVIVEGFILRLDV